MLTIGWNTFARHYKLGATDLVRFDKADEQCMIEAVPRQEQRQSEHYQKLEVQLYGEPQVPNLQLELQKKSDQQESPSENDYSSGSCSGSTDLLRKYTVRKSVSVKEGENQPKAGSIEGFLQDIRL